MVTRGRRILLLAPNEKIGFLMFFLGNYSRGNPYCGIILNKVSLLYSRKPKIKKSPPTKGANKKKQRSSPVF
jgi:hypothetical protein